MKQKITPIFVKTMFGKRVIVAQTEGTQPVFSISKQSADLIKEASGFSKRRKLFTRYEGEDFQIMEVQDRGSIEEV
ncbi:hypothetical protein [Limosilactobacillus caviae]|uniref:hypothetical protein n=1 Tax=Limosilactobacillus caviae TaxID=1769424 RepID=UPI003517F313